MSRTYAYALTLTADEYRSACYMSDRGYLGEITNHASSIEENETDGSVVLSFFEFDAWQVNDTIESDPDAVWALTTPSTSLGVKFQAFIDEIV